MGRVVGSCVGVVGKGVGVVGKGVGRGWVEGWGEGFSGLIRLFLGLRCCLVWPCCLIGLGVSVVVGDGGLVGGEGVLVGTLLMGVTVVADLGGGGFGGRAVMLGCSRDP